MARYVPVQHEPLDLEAVRARQKKARATVAALCGGKRKWEMSIPPQDTDTDLLIADSLSDIPVLIRALEAANAAPSKAALSTGKGLTTV
jgi:hypothetical protein